jgi:2-hydroxychromene-2-carboxylate isomerase
VASAPSPPVFFYDLGSPECYLAAERVMAELPVVPEWEPVLGSHLEPPILAPEPQEFAQRVLDAGLQPLRWPPRWPPETERAMLAATYAKRIGRAVAFSLAAFRQAFAGGRDLGQESTILLAAAACEMHPAAVLKGMGLRSVTAGLRRASDRALAAGVRQLPAIQISDQVLEGPMAVEGAEAALSAVR